MASKKGAFVNYNNYNVDYSESSDNYGYNDSQNESSSNEISASDKIFGKTQPKVSAMNQYDVSNKNYFRPAQTSTQGFGTSGMNKYSNFDINKQTAKSTGNNPMSAFGLGLGSYNYNSNLDNYNNIDIDFTSINKEKDQKIREVEIKKKVEVAEDLVDLPVPEKKKEKFFDDLEEEFEKENEKKRAEEERLRKLEEEEEELNNSYKDFDSLNNKNMKSNDSISIMQNEISESSKSHTKSKKQVEIEKSVEYALSQTSEIQSKRDEEYQSSVNPFKNQFVESNTASNVYNPDKHEEYLKNITQSNHNKSEYSEVNENPPVKVEEKKQENKKIQEETVIPIKEKRDTLDEVDEYGDFDYENVSNEISSNHDVVDKISHSNTSQIDYLKETISKRSDNQLNIANQTPIMASNKSVGKIVEENKQTVLEKDDDTKYGEINKDKNNKNLQINEKSNINSDKESKEITIKGNEKSLVQSNFVNDQSVNNNDNKINNYNNNREQEIPKENTKIQKNLSQLKLSEVDNQIEKNTQNEKYQNNINQPPQIIKETNNQTKINYVQNPSTNIEVKNYDTQGLSQTQFQNNPLNMNIPNNNVQIPYQNHNPNYYQNNIPNIAFPNSNLYYPQTNMLYSNPYMNQFGGQLNSQNNFLRNQHNLETKNPDLGYTNPFAPQFQQNLINEDQYLRKRDIQEPSSQNNKSQFSWNNNNNMTEIRDHTNLLEKAKEEITNKIVASQKIQNFCLSPQSKIKQFTNIFPVVNNFFSLYCFQNIRYQKLEEALRQERERAENCKYQLEKTLNSNEKLTVQNRKLRDMEIQVETHKAAYRELEEKLEEHMKEIVNIRIDYEKRMQLHEEKVVLRENMLKQHEIDEVKRKLGFEILTSKNEIDGKIKEIEYFKRKYDELENQLAASKTKIANNLEVNTTIKELQNENFILIQKNNELNDKFTKLVEEKDKLEKKIHHAKIENSYNSNPVSKLKESTNEIKIENKVLQNFSSGKFEDKSVTNKIDRFVHENDNIFEQLYIEREFNVQESILSSYIREIDRLNEELKSLKDINKNLNKIKKPNLNEKPILIEIVQEKIKNLAETIIANKISLSDFEAELYKRDTEKTGEIDYESLVKIFVDLKINIQRYSVLEIFNNFPRASADHINYNDFIASLKSKTPGNFYFQSDPDYLKNLENKIIIYESKIKAYETKQITSEKNEEKFILLYEALEKENKDLILKIKAYEENNKNKQYDQNTNFNPNINSTNSQRNQGNDTYIDNNMQNRLSNNFVNNQKNLDNQTNRNVRTNENFSQNQKQLNNNYVGNNSLNQTKDPNIEKLKNKVKELENQNSINLNDFNKKISDYDIKISNLMNLIENKNSKDKDQTLLKENLELKNEVNSIKMKKDNEIFLINEKLKKYQSKYLHLKEKYEKNEKEIKRNICSTCNQQDKYQEINEIEKKINEIEKRNYDREEHYKVLCMKTNKHQINKEIDTANKKFESERKEYIRIIQSKNKEIILIKQEFETLIKELEDLRSFGKIK